MKENKACLYVYLKYLSAAIVIMIISYYINGNFNINNKWYYLPILILPASAIAFVLFMLNCCTNFFMGYVIKNEKISYIASFIFTFCVFLFAMSIGKNEGKEEKINK